MKFLGGITNGMLDASPPLMWQQMSECTISYMLGSLLFIIIGLLLMPLYFSNSVSLVSCGNIECYEVIIIMADCCQGDRCQKTVE